MRAVVVTRCGGPEVLEVQNVPQPVPAPGQVRVAIRASGTNPVDAYNRRDSTWAGIAPPFIVGYDASGVVDALGEDVSAFKLGDEVFYMPDFVGTGSGTYAEFQVVDAGIVARKPEGMSHVEAAAIPLAAGTAYEVMVNRLAVQPGDWVLIHGAAGGVGSFAVQIAASLGARVIGSASAPRHSLLRRLGATACVDYQSGDVAAAAMRAAGGKLDAVADFVGGDTIARTLPALKPFAVAATTVSATGDLEPALDLNLTLHFFLVRPSRVLLETLSGMIAAGALRPVIDEVLPLEEAVRAHRRLDSGHGQGKIVLRVAD